MSALPPADEFRALFVRIDYVIDEANRNPRHAVLKLREEAMTHDTLDGQITIAAHCLDRFRDNLFCLFVAGRGARSWCLGKAGEPGWEEQKEADRGEFANEGSCHLWPAARRSKQKRASIRKRSPSP